VPRQLLLLPTAQLKRQTNTFGGILRAEKLQHFANLDVHTHAAHFYGIYSF